MQCPACASAQPAVSDLSGTITIVLAWTNSGPAGSPTPFGTVASTLTCCAGAPASSASAYHCPAAAKPSGTPTAQPAWRRRSCATACSSVTCPRSKAPRSSSNPRSSTPSPAPTTTSPSPGSARPRSRPAPPLPGKAASSAVSSTASATGNEARRPPRLHPCPRALSQRTSPARAHIGPLALLGRGALEVPQAQEAHDPSGGEDRAGQEQDELETPEKGGHRQVEGVLACGRGGDVDLTARDVGPDLGCPLLPGPRERPGLVVPVGQGHAGADGSQDGQPGGGADLAAGVEQA